MTAVQEFAGVYDLEHIRDLLVSGAKVARDPEAYQSVPGLTLDERAALRKEKEAGFWRQTKQLRASIIMCAVAAILQYVYKGQDPIRFPSIPSKDATLQELLFYGELTGSADGIRAQSTASEISAAVDPC